MNNEPGPQIQHWEQARRETLDHWLRVRESIGDADSAQLLQDINVTNDLCEEASQEAAGQWGRCDYCLASQQFGGCAGISLRMSEAAVENRWTDLRHLVDGFIENLKNLDIPKGSNRAVS